MIDYEISPFDTAQVVDSGVESGLKWVTSKHESMLHINGYVLLPKTHPYYDLGYSRLEDTENIRVHGGLTYSNNGWVGFDTAHGGDLWPGQKAEYINEWTKIWTPDLVVEEVKELAKQLAKITKLSFTQEEKDVINTSNENLANSIEVEWNDVWSGDGLSEDELVDTIVRFVRNDGVDKTERDMYGRRV